MIERRKVPRTEAATRAVIFCGVRRTVLGCTALNLSEEGGKIGLDRPYAMPRQFMLSFDELNTARNCQLVWAKGNFVGVQFCQAA
jgi:hypothetical protein